MKHQVFDDELVKRVVKELNIANLSNAPPMIRFDT